MNKLKHSACAVTPRRWDLADRVTYITYRNWRHFVAMAAGPPHIGASSALALSAPRRRLTALLVLGMLLVPLRRSALLPLLGKI